MKLLLCALLFIGLSARAQDHRFVALDSFLLAANKNQWVAGNTAIVMKEGKIVFEKAYGYRDREAQVPMKKDDIFRIASMTKPVVTLAAMILVEQGKLSLDDELWKYIPEFKNPQILRSYDQARNTWQSEASDHQITIRQLMTHTSGIGSGQDDRIVGALYSKNGFRALMFADSIDLATAMKKMATLPLAVKPGTKFHYGSSPDVIGRIVEIVSGMRLDQFVKHHILDPLKMKDTYFFMPEDKKDRLAVLYSEMQSSQLTRIPQGFQGYNINYPISGPKMFFSGAGGMTSTAQDYARFLQMILNGGILDGNRVLKAETIELMTKNQIASLSLGNSNKFGLGFEIESRQSPPRGASIGKLSWGGALNTTFWIDPKRKSLAILMSQVYPAIHQRDLYAGFEKFVNQAF
ncbi:MAG: class A beta-lactamase-related serine hydrolase [Pedobacter sp.]|nr:MAG: class A beta-lactamase-related serine hydrolase [Pedobacter sp.]